MALLSTPMYAMGAAEMLYSGHPSLHFASCTHDVGIAVSALKPTSISWRLPLPASSSGIALQHTY